MYIDKNDVLYVADSESRDGRTNTGQFGLPQTGYGYNLGVQRGIRIGSAKDGSVKYFIPDPCPYPYPSGSSMAEVSPRTSRATYTGPTSSAMSENSFESRNADQR
jgi:hypothetical protein